MMSGRPFVRDTMLLLLLAPVLFGCAALSTAPVSDAPVVAAESYDLPATLDAKTVIQGLEQALLETFHVAPRITEGVLVSPLPPEPPSYVLERRLLVLDHLGPVMMPRVVCPDHLARLDGYAAGEGSSSSQHRFTACIQVSVAGYRVHVIDRVRSSRVEGASGRELVLRVGRLLAEHLSGARRVAPVERIERADETPLLASAAPASGSATARDPDAGATRAHLPLVCLVAEPEPAQVRARPGDGPVLGVLERGALIAVAGPAAEAYVRVEVGPGTTGPGTTGWVRRAEVTRRPCPIA